MNQILRNSVALICSFLATSSFLAQTAADVTIKVTPVNGAVYMLEGAGGNIGVSIGEEGVFVIDDQFAPLTEKILAAIKTLSDKPITYLVNTHHHGDHTGGNANMNKAGATIIAHDNVRDRLSKGKDRQGNALPVESLPEITFNDKLNFYFNGEQIAVFHVDNAHTDGDALLYFTESNVLHTGDTYFNARYPYVDLNSGGSIRGYIAAFKKTLMVIDDETKIIPGHGSLSNKAEYEAYLGMLEATATAVQAEIDNGMSLDDVTQNKALTKKYDDMDYGNFYIKSEVFRTMLYKSLSKKD
ncbi:MAG: MBL fold metallo-hydrolase [Gilvibacter sp.]